MRSIPAGARLFVAALAVYCVCPPFTSNDSYFVVPAALSLVRHGTMAIDEFVPGAPKVALYAMEKAGAHWYNYYPAAVPVLTAPLIGILVAATALVAKFFPAAAAHAPHPLLAAFLSHDLVGGHAVGELLCGAVIAAAAVWLIWAIFRLYLPDRAAVWLSLLFAFGTTQWSIASRNLAQHGLSVLCLTLAVRLALLARERPPLIGWMAIPVALSFTVRPSNCIAVVVFTVYVAVHHRRELMRYLTFAAPVAAVFFTYNFLALGRLVPRYFVTSPIPYPPLLGLAANLVSPGRGLVIYMPVVLFAAAGVWLAARMRWLHPLSLYLAAIPAIHLFFIAPYWAGHGFGPRYFSDMTPLFFLFLVPAILHWMKMPAGIGRRSLAAAFLAFALWGVFVNLRGATSVAVARWSAVPVSVDDAKWRVWDWSDPQFLRGLR